MSTSSPTVSLASPPARLMTGVDHLELWVGNARAFAQFLMSAFGFRCVAYAGRETGREFVSYVLEQGEVRVVVTAGLTPADEVAEHVRLHGDGVRTIAFATRDAHSSMSEATARGAVVAEEIDELDDVHGVVRRGAIHAYGDTIHAFVERNDYRGAFWPGFTDERLPFVDSQRAPGIRRVDHIVANVEEGGLERWVHWHETVLGMEEMRHFDADQISTEYSALRSTVVWNGANIVLPINEPAPGLRKSQITEYLEAYRAPGVQHVALLTDDIVRAVGALRANGVRFLVPPPAYYEEVRARCGNVELPWTELERLGILVDVDSGGVLLQVFTENLVDRPTLFVEVIERRGAIGFGEGNFKALFEAIEGEQARRGNL